MKFGEKDIMDMASFVWIWSIAGGVCVGIRGGGRIQAVGVFLHVGESIRVCLFVCTCVSLFLFFSFVCLFVCFFFNLSTWDLAVTGTHLCPTSG